jgi:hypothetical protein
MVVSQLITFVLVVTGIVGMEHVLELHVQVADGMCSWKIWGWYAYMGPQDRPLHDVVEGVCIRG